MNRGARRSLSCMLPVVMVSAACGAFGGSGSGAPPPGEAGLDSTTGETGAPTDAGAADASLDPSRDGPTTPPQDSGLDAAPNKRVFVTANTFTLPATFSGLAGLDNVCKAEAAARLGGVWIAWASDNNTDARDRFTEAGAKGPWFSLATPPVKIFEAAGPMTGALPLAPITYAPGSDGGVNIGDQVVWTGTLPSGQRSGTSCESWTLADSGATVGHSGTTGSGWVNFDPNQSCASTFNHVYCFER